MMRRVYLCYPTAPLLDSGKHLHVRAIHLGLGIDADVIIGGVSIALFSTLLSLSLSRG